MAVDPHAPAKCSMTTEASRRPAPPPPTSALLANPRVKAEYDVLAPEFEIAAELLRARLRAGLSQAELAARMDTSQSTIAWLENGHTLPSTKTLPRYAEATGSKFHVRLSAA